MVSCKSVENWYREGRVIKEGEQALKKVKPRAATLNRKREIEDAQRDGETVLQGLYSLEQTEYVVMDCHSVRFSGFRELFADSGWVVIENMCRQRLSTGRSLGISMGT